MRRLRRIKGINEIKKSKLSAKKIIIILCLSLLTLTSATTLGRYVYNFVLDFYFASKNFYFESEKLKKDGALYLLDHWNGVEFYDLKISVNSFKNNELRSNSDVYYDISYNCSSTVICESDKTSGIIGSTSNTDEFTIKMTPNSTFKDGDSVVIEVKATSTAPYEKELSAQFKFVVGKFGLSHEIDDKPGEPYLEVRITNTLNFYTVKEAFGSYSAGRQIDEDTYEKLSAADKSKCISATISVNFDPSVVYIDNNSTSFLTSYDHQSQQLGNYSYIKAFKFDMEASSSSVFRLYKRDASQDYSDSGDDVVAVNYTY